MAKALPTKPKRSVFRLIPRHGAFPVAVAAGVLAFAVAVFFLPDLAVGIGANTFFVVYLGIVFIELPRLTPEALKKFADAEAPPAGVIMVVTIGVVAVAVFSLFAALNGGGAMRFDQVISGIASVVLGWFVVHTLAAMHYAYEFYESPSAAPRKGEITGGLDWPAGDPPNGVAFVYFSYQIGAAMQVSDVDVISNKMRGLVLVHTVFAFFYNTVLVAATVNVVLSAAGGN